MTLWDRMREKGYKVLSNALQNNREIGFRNFWRKNKPRKTLFEQHLENCGIIYHRIRVATPRYNEKVERQHRIDEVRFYSHLRMYGLTDGRKQMKTYNKKSNNILKSCLKYQTPNAALQDYLGVNFAFVVFSSCFFTDTSLTNLQKN